MNSAIHTFRNARLGPNGSNDYIFGGHTEEVVIDYRDIVIDDMPSFERITGAR